MGERATWSDLGRSIAGVAACLVLGWFAFVRGVRVPLLGGEHDWAFVLGPEHLNRLRDAHVIAGFVRGTGLVLLLAGIALCAWGASGSGDRTAVPPPRSRASTVDMWS